jgi:hypothetical protein
LEDRKFLRTSLKHNFLFGLLAGYRTKLLFSSCFGLGPGAGDEGVEGNRSARRKWRKRKKTKKLNYVSVLHGPWTASTYGL